MSSLGNKLYMNHLYAIDSRRIEAAVTDKFTDASNNTNLDIRDEEADNAMAANITGGTVIKTNMADPNKVTDVSQQNESHIQKASFKRNDFKLSLKDENLINGIILAEVLGKPKYLRRG